MEDLRSQGYEIEAVPHHGYRLQTLPDKLFPIEIQYKLATRQFGCAIYHFEELASTMDEAFRRGMEGSPEGTIVIAEMQTRGRGRMGRSWASPRSKGLYFSLLLRPVMSFAEATKLTLLAAVALSEAVEKVTSVRPGIKWPNDLLIEGKKLAGILTELRAEVDRVAFAVIGIGVNVNTLRSALPPEAVSLQETVGHEVGRIMLLQEILRAMETRYHAVRRQGFSQVFDAWRERSATLGSRVMFEERGKPNEGTAFDLADDGGLLVRLDNGTVVKRMAGDILLR